MKVIVNIATTLNDDTVHSFRVFDPAEVLTLAVGDTEVTIPASELAATFARGEELDLRTKFEKDLGPVKAGQEAYVRVTAVTLADDVARLIMPDRSEPVHTCPKCSGTGRSEFIPTGGTTPVKGRCYACVGRGTVTTADVDRALRNERDKGRPLAWLDELPGNFGGKSISERLAARKHAAAPAREAQAQAATG